MGSWLSGRLSIVRNSRTAAKKESATLPTAMLVIRVLDRRLPKTPFRAAPSNGKMGISQSIIPLLAEEGAKREPGRAKPQDAKREPDRAKPQESLRRQPAVWRRRRGAQTGETSRRTDHPGASRLPSSARRGMSAHPSPFQ